MGVRTTYSPLTHNQHHRPRARHGLSCQSNQQLHLTCLLPPTSAQTSCLCDPPPSLPPGLPTSMPAPIHSPSICRVMGSKYCPIISWLETLQCFPLLSDQVPALHCHKD